MEPARQPDWSDRSLLARAFDALPRATIVTTPEGEILLWSHTAEELYGWAAAEVVGRSVVDVLVPEAATAEASGILDAVRAGAVWDGDFTIRRRDGSSVQVRISDRPIVDEGGTTIAIIGASEDVTELRVAEREKLELTERLQLALEAGGLGTWRWERATGDTVWDERLEELFGLEPGTFDGTFEAYSSLLHPEDADDVLRVVDEAVESKSRYVVEHRVLWPDGTVHWILGAGQPTVDAAGEVTGTIGACADITARVLIEQERDRLLAEAVEAAEVERLSRERLEFLGRINEALTDARDRHEIASGVAWAAVPRLGDWCSIFVLPSPDATIPEITTAHVDPAMVTYAQQLQERYPYDPDAASGMPLVIRTGRPKFYPEINDAVIDEEGVPLDQLAVVRELALRSAIAVPLVKGGRVLGGIQFVTTASSRTYTEADVALAQVVAGRVASSLENRRLSEEQHHIALTLQASLLPEVLPPVPGVDLAVRYWAAGEGVVTGGDFYDVLAISDDTWGVVIGDVCGTGPAAAAITGLARHTIASAAWHGDSPATVLDQLNATMLRRGTRSFCTAAYGTVQVAPNGVEFTVASGGHPLPVLVRADGTVSTCGRPGTLIGAFERVKVQPQTVTLGPGDTVVLYSDGATDVPPPHHLTAEEFAVLVGDAAKGAATADEVADRLQGGLSAILPFDERDDDIALLVMRIADDLLR
jgi:PAS domain S-box-containing protein